MYVHQRFFQGPDAPGAAREILDATLAQRLDPEALSELRLVVSELVTNAVLHGPRGHGDIELVVDVAGDVARVEVADGGQGFTPPGGPPEPADVGGWGLVVVDRLASRWGVQGGRFTRVWAEVPLAPSGLNGGGVTEPEYARNV
ncbi:MAG: serine/threonine-protein kinase RsbW [Solirubrobacteraceae bacterium]|nr:serine/threonine-protein kinase RsbW [Solirubrobacteraceae bacterium]